VGLPCSDTALLQMLIAHIAKWSEVEQDAVYTKATVAEGHTVLHLAAKKGNLAAVQLLLQDNRMALNSEANKTVLHVAATEGHTEVVRVLLDHHSDVRLCQKGGGTMACLHSITPKGIKLLAQGWVFRNEVMNMHRHTAILLVWKYPYKHKQNSWQL
jgi:ankyrin repeat protein